MSDTAVVPTSFWKQIDHQLDRIENEKPNTFAAVRQILLDPIYSEIMQDIGRYGPRSFSDKSAFFAGSGADRALESALAAAGWVVTDYHAYYHYSMRHPQTGQCLEYIEGDLEYRGSSQTKNQ